MGFISKTTNIFWNILGSTYRPQSIRKNDTQNFCLLVYLQIYNDKSKFSFLVCCQVKSQHVLFKNPPFLREMLVSFFSSNIPLYIEKNPVVKPCKNLEMELKTYTPGQNSFSRKSNLKFCIIFNMVSITNAQGTAKIRLACSKVSLLMNYLMVMQKATNISFL